MCGTTWNKYGIYLARQLARCRVLSEVRLHEDELGAQLLRDEAWHSRPHSVLSRNVIGRRQHSHPPHSHGFMDQAGVVPHLHCRVERVHIHVQPRAAQIAAAFVTILGLGLRV